MFTTKNLLIIIGRHAAISLVAIITAAVACFFLAKEITRVSDAAAQNRRLAAALEKRTELLSTLSRDIQIIGESDTLFAKAFIPSDNILEFISALESIALKNTITQSFRFETPAPSSLSSPFPLSTVGYTNTLSLNIFTLTNYLKDFENLPYFTKIENLNISSQDPAGWRGASTVSLRATLYTNATQ